MNPNTAACGPRGVRAGSSASRRKALLFAVLASVLALVLGACSASSGSAKDEDAGDGTGRTYAPTFTAVYNEILQGSCAVPFCHLGSVNPMPLPDQASSYKELVNTAASGPYCGGMGIRVVPSNPAMSILYQKIEQPVPANLCGLPMPGSGRPSLDAKDIAQIKQWIMLGAKND